MTQPQTGQAAELRYVVGVEDTATAVGSGDVPVLATPRLLAWAEAASVTALADVLTEPNTSVGTRVELDHRAASPVGATVTVRAEVVAVDGRLVRFEVIAHHSDGTVVAHGRITRVIVDRGRFLDRVT